MTLYNKSRRPKDLEPHYSAHVSAMTAEELHSKADIAAELAARDLEIAALSKIAHCADRVTDCVAEFGDQKFSDECLCTACGEYVQALDDALDEWKRAQSALNGGKP